jgi:RNA polymerase sigma-70 factor, ECF subfamily
VAARSGERDAIRAMLAENVELVGDGGGKVPSFGQVLRGADRIANLFYANARRFAGRITYRMATINGEPGLLRYVNGELESATSYVTDGERIVGIYSVRNPDKLAGIPPLQ